MDKQSHYLEQYKLHREEIMLYIQQMFRTEWSAVLAVGATYAWLIHEAEKIHVRWQLWGVPPFIIFLASIRCGHLVFEMKRIGKYLNHLEQAAFNKDGWEHFKAAEQRHWFDKIANSLSGFVWISALCGSIWLSWHLYHHEPIS